MSRCVCSVRALEAFVRDFAGLGIRSTTRRIPDTHSRRAKRCLSTRAALYFHRTPPHHLETAPTQTNTLSDDAYIPFDPLSITSSPAQSRPAFHDGLLSALSSPALPHQRDSPNVDEYEPEIEIHNDLSLQSTINATDQDLEGRPDIRPAEVSLEFKLTDPRDYADSKRFGLLVNEDGDQDQASSDAVSAHGQRRRARLERKGRRFMAMDAEDQARVLMRERNKEKKALSLAMAATGKTRREQTLGLRKVESEKSKPTRTSPTRPASTNTRRTQPSTKSFRNGRESDSKARGKFAAISPTPTHVKESWQTQKAALQSKHSGESWAPRKRISPDALSGIRALHSSQPSIYTTAQLSTHFKTSPEAIRRILKSKWRPSEEEQEGRRDRWERRGERKWSEMVEMGIRPPKKWRDMGVGQVLGGREEKPAWKRRDGEKKGKGERWIHQPQTELFTRAADVVGDEGFDADPDVGGARRRSNLAERIL